MKTTVKITTLLILTVFAAGFSFDRPKTQNAPPVGKYPCYYYGYNYALTSSSLTEIEILPKSRMKIVGESVAFNYEAPVLTLTEGEFKGAVAHYKLDSDKKPAIIFRRKENEAGGHKIDMSDTWCYLETK